VANAFVLQIHGSCVNFFSPAQAQQVIPDATLNTQVSFVMTGRGGIPQNPMEQLNLERPWVDLRKVSTVSRSQESRASSIFSAQSEPLLEATSWYRNLQTGKVELIAAQFRTRL
jgi:large exoprotein involved in heme utilization and adhesion